MSLRFGMHQRLGTLAVLVLGAGCASGVGQRDGDAVADGFMVLNAKAVDFGLAPGDTLVERSAAQTSASLRQQVEGKTRRLDYETGCTRYFGSVM
jgi:hypothetical protein